MVKVHNAYQMAEAQPVFFFAHPAPGAEGGADGGAAGGAAGGGVHSNARHKRLVFETPLGGALHGFIGYFHSTLCAPDLGDDLGDDLGGDPGGDPGAILAVLSASMHPPRIAHPGRASTWQTRTSISQRSRAPSPRECSRGSHSTCRSANQRSWRLAALSRFTSGGRRARGACGMNGRSRSPSRARCIIRMAARTTSAYETLARVTVMQRDAIIIRADLIYVVGLGATRDIPRR